MSSKLVQKARKRLSGETGCRSNPWGGRISVALVYPNTYYHAMSNMGYLSVYHLINSRTDALCERFFLPDPEDIEEHRKTGYPLFSHESGRFLSEFDVIAFSLSFENDYVNLPLLFDLAKVPLFRRDRQDRFPLVICGGVCAFLNPEPLADLMDLFVVGEGEAILPDFFDTLIGEEGGRGVLLRRLAEIPGIYVPSLYEPHYNADGLLTGYSNLQEAPQRVRRQWVGDLDGTESRSFILTDETEFSDMSVTEISRGCSRGCRFCAAGFIYLPPRERSFERLLEQVRKGLCMREKVGLLGAAVSDYSKIAELEEAIVDEGGSFSVSSLRIDSLDERQVRALKRSKVRTVALAPEAGSQRMRDLINKRLDEEEILAAVELLAREGIQNLKLYFLIGLPTEDESDIKEMLDLVERVRGVWLAEGKKQGRLGNLVLSVNPFIPKPFTPFQWAPMAGEKELEKKMRTIRSAVARMPNTEVIFESIRSAILQAFFSRGDRRTAQVLPLLASGRNLRSACREVGLDPALFVTRPRGEEEVFPWEILDNGVRRDYLLGEYRRGLQGKVTPPCAPGCRRCGVCN